jgi:hypothetical protein
MKIDLKKLLILLLILSVLIKISALNLAMYDDESNYGFSITNADELGFNPHYYSPITMQLLGIFFTALFGIATYVFRLVPFIISFFTIAIVYLFAKEHYNKKTALISVFLLLVSFYFTLASLQIDIEGSLVTLFILSTFYCFTKSEKTKKLNWRILTGIFLALSLISKHNAIIVVLILGLYSLFKNKKILKTIYELFVPFMTGFVIYLIYIILSFVHDPNHVNYLLFGASRPAIGLTLLSPIIFMFWATPLLIVPALLAIKNKKRENNIFIFWIIVTILFNTFVISKGDFSRYYMHLIPAMVILGASYLSKIKFTKSDIKKIGLFTTLFFVLLYIINMFDLKYVSRITSDYINEIISLNFNFLFSYTTSSGPLFGVSFATIMLTLILSIIFILCVLSCKNKKFAKLCLISFLAISLAFNILLIQEYIFHVQGPNPSETTYEMLDYFKENNLNYPVYSNNEAILFYLNNSYWLSNTQQSNVRGLDDYEQDYSDIHESVVRLKKTNGTILLLNWPYIPERSPALDVASNCELDKVFYSKNYKMGMVYVC